MVKIKPQALLLQSKKKKIPAHISLTSIVFFILFVFFVIICGFSTYRHFSQRSMNQRDQGYKIVARKGLAELKDPDVPRYVTLKTSKGMMTVELLNDNSPEVVDEFIGLCEKGYFKGKQFHHVIKNFIMQAGDIDSISLATAEDWASGAKQYSEHKRSSKLDAFMVGTPKMKQDKKGFELYINTVPIPNLDDKLILFGQVVKGVDVVQEIEEADTNDHHQPKSPITINDITLEHAI